MAEERFGGTGTWREYDEEKVSSWRSGEPSEIVRNRLKVESAIQNAKAFLAVQDEFCTFDEYIWGFVGNKQTQNAWKSIKEVPAKIPAMLEKASFAITIPILYALERVNVTWVGSASMDATWLVLFVIAFMRTPKEPAP